MKDSSWQPGASIDALKVRAELYQTIRAFFQARNILEIDVPVFASSTPTDPFIQAIPASICSRPYFLQSSPEFYMKRLLAAGSGDIYNLGKAFRDEEAGRKHNPEFTILEWYRMDFDEHQLIAETIELITVITQLTTATKVSYRDVFEQTLGINPHQATLATLKSIANKHINIDINDSSPSTWLDLLMTHAIEPTLNGITAIYDYPSCQAALAKITTTEAGDTVARRFEIYIDDMELANGYWELTDAAEQERRFVNDTNTRNQAGIFSPPADKKLLAALEHGMPSCAGVAMGIDRLLMYITQATHIDEVLSFSFKRT